MASARGGAHGRPAQAVLCCTGCGARNYRLRGRRINGPQADSAPLSLKKYCKNCNTHVVHRESK
jgi:ribosomal protein L33